MAQPPSGWETTAETLMVSDSAVAPIAGQVVANLGQPPAGPYRIVAFAGYGATADVIDSMTLFVGNRNKGKLPVISGANFTGEQIVLDRVNVFESEAIQVRANINGAAGAVYKATIIATQIVNW